jgi:hypothetical protein
MRLERAARDPQWRIAWAARQALDGWPQTGE